MGYEINSPVKQIWLPLDYNFLSELLSGDDDIYFGDFNKEYQKKYGIDLHDVFGLGKTEGNSFFLILKNDLTGTYNIGKLNGIATTKYANTSGVRGLQSTGQTESQNTLATIAVGVDEFEHGFDIYLPRTSEREVNSIDDLIIKFYGF